jgi:hypothetical protein
VRFTMPGDLSMETLPKPNNAAVRLVELAPKRMAAIRFSGVVDEKDLAENEASLREGLSKQGLKPKGSPQYAFYDPPWTLPWNRRNEVLVEIERK